MRILVTGSRMWTDYDVIEKALVDASDPKEQTVIIHGGARGADDLADLVATRMGWDVYRYPAKWNEYGKRAGYIRNAEMVKRGADICLAFIENNSRGATMCADLAEKAGIPVRRICK